MPRKDPEEQKAYRRAYYLANREKALAKMPAWRAQNFERHADARWRSELRLRYGLTSEGYRALLAEQGGVCAICGCEPSGRVLDVDHDHQTGRVRGLLCNPCNRVLGMLKDDPERLRRAIAYLERARA